MSGTIGISLTCLLVTFCAFNVLASIGQDIVFAESGDLNMYTQNADRKPVLSSQLCNENELFYPGDKHTDYVCDCKPGYIYYPKTDRCHGAYRQGPCKNNEFLMITTGNYIPECLPNPCFKDGLVAFKNSCHPLDTAGPCELPELSFVVGVNSTTLIVECIRLSEPDLTSRFGPEDEPKVEPKVELYSPCLIGGKQSYLRKC